MNREISPPRLAETETQAQVGSTGLGPAHEGESTGEKIIVSERNWHFDRYAQNMLKIRGFIVPLTHIPETLDMGSVDKAS